MHTVRVHTHSTAVTVCYFLIRRSATEMNLADETALAALWRRQARPPRCLVGWKRNSPRSFFISSRSACRDGLGRNSAVSRAVSESFLSRSSTQMNKTVSMGERDVGAALRTIPRLDLSEFANLAEFVVFSLGDQIHPKEIIAGP